VSFDGDISRMGQLAQRLNDLARVPSRAVAKVSREIGRLIQEEFDVGADPYGTAWKPLAAATVDKGRTPPPLTDTRAMRNSVRVKPLSGAGVGVTVSHPAAPHQTGWHGKQGDGPARPILPSGVMPAKWNEAIKVVIDEEFRK
jgi:hypothetical protein